MDNPHNYTSSPHYHQQHHQQQHPMTPPSDPNSSQPPSLVDYVVKLMNFIEILYKPRRVSNFRWANTTRDAVIFLGQFAKGQFTKIYGRITTKYKYHPQQRYQTAVRHFDLSDPLAAQMTASGNQLFYQHVCGLQDFSGRVSNDVDLTRLDTLSTATASANYLYNEVLRNKTQEAAKLARDCYLAGFSRPVNAFDFADWEKLRQELRASVHDHPGAEDGDAANVSLVAISYKGKEVKITRRMALLQDDGTPLEGSLLSQLEVPMTDDFVDDFRWSQLVRSCMEIASLQGTPLVRIWVDRLVMMKRTKQEKKHIYSILKWEDFGLFCYAVCPVVRVYDAEERFYGTDFWRKLETVMGVAGRGLFVDDYMLRKYDYTIYFGPSVYKRLGHGLSRIGGGGIYVRSVTLALATAILTDGISTSAANEDLRTKASAGRWKAWALRTITEGAYSRVHSCMLREEDEFQVGYREFKLIAFWESMVSRSSLLQGNSYLDMSLQRTMTWRKSACWNGILEWIGMLENSCNIKDEGSIMQFLSRYTKMEMHVSTTGHVACIIYLTSDNGLDKRSIVVNLSRFSTARTGHVTAVAEATELRGPKILPFYLKFVKDPDGDQDAEITDEGILFEYKQMKVEYSWMRAVRIIGIIILAFSLIGLFVVSPALLVITFLVWVGIVLGYLFFIGNWPWFDRCDVGEAVFDNLLLHALYGSGIKSQYRKLETVPYDQIGWTGIAEAYKER